MQTLKKKKQPVWIEASRKWHQKLTNFLISKGFVQSFVDNSMLTRRNKNGDFIALLIYSDDVLLASNNMELFKEAKGQLDAEYKIKDLGVAKYFLGLELARSIEGLTYHGKNTLWIF